MLIYTRIACLWWCRRFRRWARTWWPCNGCAGSNRSRGSWPSLLWIKM